MSKKSAETAHNKQHLGNSTFSTNTVIVKDLTIQHSHNEATTSTICLLLLSFKNNLTTRDLSKYIKHINTHKQVKMDIIPVSVIV